VKRYLRSTKSQKMTRESSLAFSFHFPPVLVFLDFAFWDGLLPAQNTIFCICQRIIQIQDTHHTGENESYPQVKFAKRTKKNYHQLVHNEFTPHCEWGK